MITDVEIPIPQRCRGTLKRKVPKLENTLYYFLSLIFPNEMSRPWEQLGMEKRRFERHINHPHWQTARQIAQTHIKSRQKDKTFGEYVFKHLSPEARRTWEDLVFWTEHDNPTHHIQRLVSGKSEQIRQELYIHALVCTHFDASKALYMTGLSRKQVERWVTEDLEFAQLVEEIQFHKKNFFEKAMLNLVAEGNPVAVVWANKTVNADRGYSEKIRMEHTLGADTLDLDKLDLDIDTRRKVLEAMRRAQLKEEEDHSRKALPAPAVDVEAEPVAA